MAGMEKEGKAAPAKSAESIESMTQRFQQIVAEIAGIQKGRKEVSQLKADEKKPLSRLYTKAALLAKKISESAIGDDALSASYKDKYDRLTQKAEALGSTITGKVPDMTFDDIKGLENVKKVVKSFQYMASHPDIVDHYKMKGGLGLLLYGAPGTGKTMFAEAVAHEMKLPLFVVTPSDIFGSLVGESEKAVRQLFEDMRMCEDGCVLFVDECESIFSRRKGDDSEWKSGVTTELLQGINGFGDDDNKGKIIMIAATNLPESIDPAYLRYKRFSHKVHVTPPDREAKLAIISSKLKGIRLEGITIDEILDKTEYKSTTMTESGEYDSTPSAYYTGADLCGLIEDACRQAIEILAEKNSDTPIALTREMFEKSFAKVYPSVSAERLERYANFESHIE